MSYTNHLISRSISRMTNRILRFIHIYKCSPESFDFWKSYVQKHIEFTFAVHATESLITDACKAVSPIDACPIHARGGIAFIDFFWEYTKKCKKWMAQWFELIETKG